ncbi:MAG TPA: MFS transporter [Steroidobacteraceae bacterium]|nr:MFS transporter [Steroidobacteraceae bacterium]
MPRLLIGICSLIYMLDGLIHSILGPLAPDVARSLALTNAQLGPIFSANLLGQCIGLIAVPLLGARLSQRAVVLLSLLGFGLAQAATATAHDATSLFAWRLVTGFFLGGALPSCLALVTAAAPAVRRGLAIMVLFTGYGLGATLAGVVANAFADLGGWRTAMLVVAAACGATSVLGALYLREPAPSGGTPTADQAIDRPNPLRLVSRRYLTGTLMLWLLFISMLTISYCLTSWLPTLLVEVGRDPRFAALSISIFSLGGIIAALGVGLLIDRWGAIRTLMSFLGLAAALLFVVGQVLASATPWVLMTLLAACGFFVLGAYGGINVVLATFYAADLRATGIGWAKSVGRIGTVAAPVLIGSALTLGMEETTIMSMFSVPAALSVLFLAVIAASGRQAADART